MAVCQTRPVSLHMRRPSRPPLSGLRGLGSSRPACPWSNAPDIWIGDGAAPASTEASITATIRIKTALPPSQHRSVYYGMHSERRVLQRRLLGCHYHTDRERSSVPRAGLSHFTWPRSAPPYRRIMATRHSGVRRDETSSHPSSLVLLPVFWFLMGRSLFSGARDATDRLDQQTERSLNQLGVDKTGETNCHPL